MGLPVKKFIISTNENDEVPQFLETGQYNAINPSKNCISSAMNVGHPSNLARILSLYKGTMDEKGTITKTPDMAGMRKDFYSKSVSDQETRDTIAQCYRQFRLLLEPHGAVAWNGLMSFLKNQPEYLREKFLCISLETAHPAKFGEEIRKVINIMPDLPDSLLKMEGKKEEYISLGNNYEVFKSYLVNNY
jgi:threonine synthase